MTERSQRLHDVLAALDRGTLDTLTALFRTDAQWRGIDGIGWKGETPL